MSDGTVRAFLYTGGNRAESVRRLAVSVASLKLPTYVAAFGGPTLAHSLAPYVGVLPIDLVRIRLPGLDLPRSGTAADEVAVEAVMAVLHQVFNSGEYRLIILDGVREALAAGALEVAALYDLAGQAADETEVALT